MKVRDSPLISVPWNNSAPSSSCTSFTRTVSRAIRVIVCWAAALISMAGFAGPLEIVLMPKMIATTKISATTAMPPLMSSAGSMGVGPAPAEAGKLGRAGAVATAGVSVPAAAGAASAVWRAVCPRSKRP